MNFISNLISPPTAEHLSLNHYIIMLISVVFLVYIGILFGTVFLSLIHLNRSRQEENPFYLHVSRDLIEILMGNKAVGIVMGILPALVLTITFSQILYDTQILISQYFLYIFLFTVAAVVFSNLFKNASLAIPATAKPEEIDTRKANLWGGLILLALALVIFTFTSSTSLILFPSLWGLERSAIPVFFDFSVAVRFLILFAAAFALTGSAIIFFYFNWAGGKANADQEYRDYFRKLGGGISIGSTLVLPILILWNFKVIPPIAETMSGYWVAALTIGLLFIIALLLYQLLKNSTAKYGTAIFILFIIAFLFMMVNDNIARERALTEHTLELIANAEAIEAQRLAEREQSGTPAEADEALGEQIYNTKCIACHRFDRRVVGPPYNEVLPKYENNMDGLVEFILSPVKKNPDYPMMPNQGLKPHEAQSVAKYIMDTFQSESK